LSTTICRPFVASVSSSELVGAVVVSVTDARSIVPEFVRSTLRWTVSPGASAEALTLRRFVAAPVAPERDRHGAGRDRLVLGRRAGPRRVGPEAAMLAAAPSTATVARSFCAVERAAVGRPRRSERERMLGVSLIAGVAPDPSAARPPRFSAS
jgi:hypothetical protein